MTAEREAFEADLTRRLDAANPAWVVTRTRRLARSLSLAVAARRAGDGRAVAETPPVHDLDEWMLRLAPEVLASHRRILLSRTAERVLWEQVIGRNTEVDAPSELLDASALAATASEAWERILSFGEPDWNVPLLLDAETFRTWLAPFRARLDEAGLVTRAELPALVASAIERGDFDERLPETVLLLGFEREDPSLARLRDALASRGVEVEEHAGPLRAEPARPRLLRARRRSEEARAVASRIRRRLLEEPGLRVAVLAPDPSAWGSLLERVFEEELDPRGVAGVEAGGARRFDFAEAPTLVDYPLVASALDLLHLGPSPIPFELASRILLSARPRVAEAEGGTLAREESASRDRDARAKAEAMLRRDRRPRFQLASSRGRGVRGDGGDDSIAGFARRAGAGAFASRLERLASHLAASRVSRRSPSEWRREWVARLEILGWPGPLTVEGEGLVFRRWRDAIDEFAALEAVEPSMGERLALSRLRAVCAARRVQPASEGLSVQVMGLLDAAGLDFDLVFAIGMTATAFPAPPRPNALLPVAWQRSRAGMPRASVEGERALAEAVWARVLRSSGEVFASYAAFGDGDDEQGPSALVAGLEAEDVDAAECEPWWLAASRPASREERPEDRPGPARVRRGGSSIVVHQSNCPFRAFAASRLGAEKLPEVAPQPDAARRGTLVHAVLEQAYREVSTSTDLAGLDDANLAEHARRSVAAVLAGDTARGMLDDDADLEEGVRTWLEEMAFAWMRCERDERVGAWEVVGLEAGGTAGTTGAGAVEPEGGGRTQATTGAVRFPAGEPDPLEVRYRIDRIDRLEGGGLLLLDYKTSGSAKTKTLWKGDRPEDAQLPLYLALLAREGHRVEGIAFANLSARDKCSLDGLAAGEVGGKVAADLGRSKKDARPWEDVRSDLCATVESLARSYLAGDARVDPRSEKACDLCGGRLLCRVVEVGGAAPEEEGEESE